MIEQAKVRHQSDAEDDRTLISLSAAERERVISRSNETPENFLLNRTIPDLFETQVRKTPNLDAVEHEQKRLTYTQLNSRANQLARFLVNQGVGPDQVVGVCIDRSVEMVIALLGILKAGGAYLPLDPNYPRGRIEQMLDDAKPQVLITETELIGVLPSSVAKLIAIDQELEQLAGFVDENVESEELGISCEKLAYVIYTSGSTGRPKGIAMPHRAMVNLIEWHGRTFGSGEGQRVLQFAALSFDVAFQEIFSTLCAGGTLVLLDEWVRRDTEALSEFLNRRSIQRFFVPPAMLHAVAEHCEASDGVPESLVDVITAGEQLRISPAIRGFFRRLTGCRLHNHYGPAETHVVTSWTLTGDPAEWPDLPPIGRPVANTQLYLLDGERQPVPVGMTGEIYIGGACVSHGYFHQPELTDERFIPDPYSGDENSRMYKTGDLGSWKANGILEYLGRNDDQVKIRGFRIEVAEIEVQLARHEHVNEAAVVAREDVPGEKRLVAYVTPRHQVSPSISDLRSHLKMLLPEYMMPSAFVVIGQLPLTPSGKLDRRALPPPEAETLSSCDYEAPHGEVEERVAEVWRKILRIERIGRNDDFFELGGHSLIAAQLVARLRLAGLSADATMIYLHPTLAEFAETLDQDTNVSPDVFPNGIPAGCDQITPEMLPLVELEPEHIHRIARSVPGGVNNIQDIYPLAPLQEGMLFHHLLNGKGGDTYVIPMLFSLSSHDRLAKFIAALRQVIERHDILRTAVVWEGLPQPVQVVYRNADLPVEKFNLQGAEDAIEQLMWRMRPGMHRLDLRQAPLMRLQIAADPHSDRWFALLQLHHLIGDHESEALLLNEVSALLDGNSDDLLTPVAYRDHVVRSLTDARSEQLRAYFLHKLRDVDEPTAPFGLNDVYGDGTDLLEGSSSLAEDLSRRIRVEARRLKVSAAALFHSAWALVLSHVCGRDDVVFGTLVLGRTQLAEHERRTIGSFINTLPVRAKIEGRSARELVEQMHRDLGELLQWERASLAVAQRCSGIAGSVPLFTALLNYRYASLESDRKRWQKSGFELLALREWTNYPVVLTVDDSVEGFSLTVQTDRRIDPGRMVGYMRTIMESLVGTLERDQSTPALMLSFLPDSERYQVIGLFNATQAEYPRDKLIHELFEEQAKRTPDAVAVVYEGTSLTYAELNAKSNQLARYLRDRGVGADQLVGICVERSLEMVVGLLGILKAGGAYVPLDPAYPPERLAYMLEDAAPQVLLTQERLRGRLPGSAAESVWLDSIWDRMASYDTANLASVPRCLTSGHLAYVIYTSGSTGKPKGVMVEHRNVMNLIRWHCAEFRLRNGSRCSSVAAVAFDALVWEIWPCLSIGATVLLASAEMTGDVEKLLGWWADQALDISFLPTPIAEFAFSQNISNANLGIMLVGGDRLKKRVVHRGTALINNYGPTECTVVATSGCVEDGEVLHIGRPIYNTRIYILNKYREPVPIGVAGEIYIGGAGVARGYWKRPELTAERFLSDPFSTDAQARMYKTGDLGRWQPDGTIEYLGRNDHQVKIRGFRIELGEIEAQLTGHGEVKEAVVLAREDVAGEKRLVAYVVPAAAGQSLSVEALREYLKGVLPDYMVPSAFVMLERLPLTPNGKLDQRALPAPELSAYVSRQYEAPIGEVEETLAGIWQNLLKVERVGRNDNFFELGGHSLLIVQMLERLRPVGLSAEVRQVFESQTLADLAGALSRGAVSQIEVPSNRIPLGCEAITPEMLPLVDLELEHIARIVGTVPGGAANVQDIYPLAPLQEGMLFHHLLHQQGGDTYVLLTLLSVSSRKRLQDLIAAFQAVIDRHDVLRTAVLWEQLSRPVQVVYRQVRLPVEELALDRDRDAQEQIRERMSPALQRLELRQAPLMRLQIAADPHSPQWYALLQLHHLVCDNQSLDAMLAEVMAYLEGRERELPETVGYREHVAEALAYAQMYDAQTFFRGKFSDVEEPTAPFGLLDVYGDGSQVEQAHEEFDASLAQRLRAQARRLGVSVATLFHVAWGLVVARTSGRDDVVYGTVLLGRLQGSAGAQRTLGMFINTLPLRLRLAGVGIKQLVKQTQRELVELFSHEQASLAEAQRCSGMSGSAPLFTTLLNYRHGAVDRKSDLGDAEGVTVLAGQGLTNYPIMLSVDELSESFELTADTDCRIDPQRFLGYMRTAVQSLVQALEEAPQTPALTLTVMPESERRHVLQLFNATQADYPKERLIHELFEEQAQRTPEAVAVVYAEQSLTYTELNAKANQLAWYLRERGVAPDQLVGICVERSLEMVVGLLGILKAGGAYVPLDPAYPTERLEFILADASPKIVLIQNALRRRVRTSAELIALDDQWNLIDREEVNNLSTKELGLRPDHLAYVIYTSGSTGKPKGVTVEHRNVLLLWQGLQGLYAQTADCKRVALNASITFDASVQQLTQLLSGRTLYVLPEDVRRDPVALLSFLERQQIAGMDCTPSQLKLWLEAGLLAGIGWKPRMVLVGGEAIDMDLWTKLSSCKEIQFYNVYGPTECTVDVTVAQVSGDTSEPHLGRPMHNRRVYVLNRECRPMPVGVVGEIYVGGAGVARGYWERPELTAERFLADPFSADAQARMYKTGDLGRWRSDGTIEFLGRNDQQVKIRGFRIELGEIEAQLTGHGEVKEAVVLAREDVPGEKRLVAYVVPTAAAQTPSVEALREHLKGVLPEYMVPSAFVMLERFPLTPNGKLDRRALPAPELSAYVSREYEAPIGEVEEILAGIWQSLLKVERVGRKDNFFELGGHSLLIVQMLERLRRVGLSAEVRRVLESPTLSDLASMLISGNGEAVEVPPNLIPATCERVTPEMLPLIELEQEHIDRIAGAVPGGAVNIQDIYPLAPLQEGMLFHHLLGESGAGTYVLASVLSVSSRQRLDELVAALQALIDRHDVLRTAILWEGLPRPIQVVYRFASLPVSELSLAVGTTPREQLREWLSPARQRIELQRAPLMRLTIAADLNSHQWYAVLQLHHLVCDNVSLELLLGEVRAFLAGRGEQLPNPTAYRKHVAEALVYARRHDGKAFFCDKLQDIDESTAPLGLMNVHGDGSRIVQASQPLEAELAQRLRAQAKRLKITAATLFHAAWALVVARTTGRDDVVFGTVLLGRLHGSAGGEQALGMFINTLPVRIKLHGLASRELIERTQRELIGVLIHEHTSLAVAQRSSGVSASNPLFSSLLNYRHGTADLQPSFGPEINLIESYAWTNYPLMLSIDETENGFTFTADTDRDVDPTRILSYMHTAVRSLVEALEQDGPTPVLLLEILPESERQMLNALNATRVDYKNDMLIHELFEVQVRQTPDAVAVEHEGRQLTYAQLNRRANQLARYLASQGVGPDKLVAICMDRGLEMIVALLGILKAGGAYLPLDPNYPPERIRHMLDDADPQMILTETDIVGVLPVSPAQVIALDERLGHLVAFVDEDLKAAQLGLTPGNLVYVIYTSGSTGKPKGTAMPHRSLGNLIEWHREAFGSGHGVRVLQFAALSFDVAFQEIFSTLCTGGTLVLLDEWIRRDAGALTELLANRSIGRLFVPPLMLQSLAEYGRSASVVPRDLQDVITAGEQLRISPEIREFFMKVAPCRLHNHYGPTETHVVTALLLEGDPAEWPTLPPIGRGIANTQVHLLDKQMQPVPMGVIGEIYIGGANVAKGYLNHPELTNQRFVVDPYSSDPGARLYKTGDLGRWRKDGTLEFVGRNDDQVKIRGFRIELREIEVQLARHEKVKDTAVVIREDTPGNRRLVAYITPRGEACPGVDDLRTYLKSVLPEFMVPSAFVVLDTLPVTPSGKLDRKSLPAPELGAYVHRDYEPPRGAIEEVLAAIWQDLLHVERIGRNDNFFELGGHSLLIVQMRERLRSVGLFVEVRRAFESPTLADLAGSLIRGLSSPTEAPPNLVPPGCERITPEMLPLIALQPEDIEQIVQSIPGGAANIQDIYPLVPLQEGMLFHYLLGGESGDAYVLPMLFSVSSEEKLEALIDAFELVISRHDVLRTAVLWEHLPRPVQVVCRSVSLPVDRLRLDSASEPLLAIKERMQPKFLRLDIRQAPLLRMEVAEAGEGEHHVLLKLHHFLCDHDSLEVLISELVTCLDGRAAELPKVSQFRKHVAQTLSHAQLNDAEAFFRTKLGDVDEPTAPYGLLDIHGDGSRVVGVYARMEAELARRLRAQARNCGVTAATLFYVAWALVVSRTTGREDVVYGTLLSGRMHGSAGAERIVGMFINTLPIRLKLKGLTVRSSVERTQHEIVDLLNYEQASLAVAQRCSDVPASAPLFTTLLNYRHSAIDIETEFSRTEGFKFHQLESWTNYPIIVSVEDLGEEFALGVETDQALVPKRLMEYTIAALERLVDGLERSPHVPLLELEVVPESERLLLLEAFNGVQQPSPELLVHEVFEERARLHPESIAVAFDGVTLSYAELNRRANQLGWYLRERGVGPDVLVGICVERSLDMVVGLLGILKAGGAYVPLDPTYPPERLTFMFDDAALKVVLVQERLKGRLPLSSASVIILDSDWNEIGKQPPTDLPVEAAGLRSDHLAYVIYTSGSTGKPKGVMVEHRNVTLLWQGLERIYAEVATCKQIALNAPINFDASAQQLVQLLSGRTLHVVMDAMRRDPAMLLRFIEEHRIDCIDCTPTQLKSWIEAGLLGRFAAELRLVLVGGEAIDSKLWRALSESKGAAFYNMYGPTECTVDATAGQLDGSNTEPHIGRPMENRRVYILDRHGKPVPIGVTGEICLGGAGVARGYLNRAQLTAERFVPDPFSADANARMYKTGDLGRWRADGVIEYLGRNDEQVKIRGYRIELGEIEARLATHPEVKQAVVVMREDAPGEKRLVAYVVPASAEQTPSVEALREHLKGVLPDYMVPSAFVMLERFPLTPNGKLDRRALPTPDLSACVSREYEAPVGEVEEILAGIWQSLLKVQRVSRNHNFFELGGHSLIGMRLISEIFEHLAVRAPVVLIFQCPTIELMANAIESLRCQVEKSPNCGAAAFEEVAIAIE